MILSHSTRQQNQKNTGSQFLWRWIIPRKKWKEEGDFFPRSSSCICFFSRQCISRGWRERGEHNWKRDFFGLESLLRSLCTWNKCTRSKVKTSICMNATGDSFALLVDRLPKGFRKLNALGKQEGKGSHFRVKWVFPRGEFRSFVAHKLIVSLS